MSTYTDLKNRVKETITVGFRPEDRVTTQKVRFYNEENEYWGSFSGSLSGKIDIYKGKLSSVDVYNATLIDPVVKTSTGLIIDLGSMTDQLEELSVYAYEDLSGAIQSCTENIIDISNAISAVSVDMADRLNGLSSMFWTLSSAFDDEVSSRIQSDDELSASFMAYADRRRHYEIYSMDAAPQMPIKAKEFAVNKLANYNLPNGFVVDDRK